MPDLEWHRMRTQALTIACLYCPAGVGEPCVVPDGRGHWAPLAKLPAHDSRIRASQEVTR